MTTVAIIAIAVAVALVSVTLAFLARTMAHITRTFADAQTKYAELTERARQRDLLDISEAMTRGYEMGLRQPIMPRRQSDDENGDENVKERVSVLLKEHL